MRHNKAWDGGKKGRLKEASQLQSRWKFVKAAKMCFLKWNVRNCFTNSPVWPPSMKMSRVLDSREKDTPRHVHLNGSTTKLFFVYYHQTSVSKVNCCCCFHLFDLHCNYSESPDWDPQDHWIVEAKLWWQQNYVDDYFAQAGNFATFVLEKSWTDNTKCSTLLLVCTTRLDIDIMLCLSSIRQKHDKNGSWQLLAAHSTTTVRKCRINSSLFMSLFVKKVNLNEDATLLVLVQEMH